MAKRIYELDGVLINSELSDIRFTCNLDKCKGACCTLESEYGAPLNPEEIPEIEKILEIVNKYLPEENIAEIKKNGFWEAYEDMLMTRTIDKRECVFVYYNDGIAKCAIEKAYFNKEIAFRKPISCHLFPIRISQMGGDILRYCEFSECDSALEFGKETNLNIIQFCRDSLIRKYGKKWYDKLKFISGS